MDRNRGKIAGVAGGQPGAEAVERAETFPDRQKDGEKGDRDHHEERQAERHLDLPRDRPAVRERLRDGDADGPLQRVVVVEPVGGRLVEPRAVIGREYTGIGVVGLQQDAPCASRTM